ncbi:hypothetical protein FIU29_13275 [Enterococcus faecium]|nr:hypothetical protein FIU29_13275 [Enterococcus faecium]HAR1890594.1 hypothetical protein [Enterococcus faecium]
MARPVLDAMDMDTLTKGRYVQLLARGYSPKEMYLKPYPKEQIWKKKDYEKSLIIGEPIMESRI